MGQEHYKTSSQGAGRVRNVSPLQWAQGHPQQSSLVQPDPPGSPTARGHLGAAGPGTRQESQSPWCVPQQRPSPHTPHPVLARHRWGTPVPSPYHRGALGLPVCPLTWMAVHSSRAGTRPAEEKEEDRHEEGARSCHGGC